ncbi:BZ3500_MvSof-1268-A1-R1_Chr10-1g02748 [Microbotryum saponariae]|uniref:BZ3500_MvSof-1268-A1-R1_Chr10-1g02748 protein n=1 Tax=Microbotryum saponariae TaxID=289078 RepID=A0A2X0NKW6_9BASI|nr:BZ3500_MvSof-1268-A1-R1_Chr10-1g02748 [Microbotryum saponariae]SDA06237.1 BZ3501_MvSof-1269-A2-R1_Chr10-1g02349 [Microbotryum saponariae]
MASTCQLPKGVFSDPQAHERVLLAARQLARSHHSQYDPSHDYHHVQRVVRNALVIARSFNTTHPIKGEEEQRSETANSKPVDLAVVELAALFHDLLDSKYLPADQKGMTAQERLSPFWNEYASNENGVSESTTKNGASAGKDTEFSTDRQRLVERIMEHVSFSKEVKRIAQGSVSEWEKRCRELHCVQDADKLDAIGAFGIMRCSAYSAMTNRPLYVTATSTKNENTQAANDCAIQHFHDKLFKLEGMIKTSKGREMARKRTELMRVFVRGVEEEWLEGEGEV